MSSLWNFTVGAPSPLWAYGPFNGGNASVSWVPVCGGDGIRCDDGSAYVTGLDGATLTLPFNGSSIALYGNVTGTATLTATLDSSVQPLSTVDPNHQLLAQFNQLQQGAHTLSVVIHTVLPTDRIFFTHAVITVDTGLPSVNTTSTYIDDTSSRIVYPSAGNWSSQPNFPGTHSPSSLTSTTYHESTVYDTPAVLQFNGSAVFVYGPCTSRSGAYITAIPTDGISTWANVTFVSLGNATFENCLRYFQAGLSPDIPHTLTFANWDQTGLTLDLDYVEVVNFAAGSSPNSTTPSTSTPSPSSGSTTNVGAIVGGVIGGVTGVALIIGALVFFLMRRRRHAHEQPTPFHVAGMDEGKPMEASPVTISTVGFGYPREKRTPATPVAAPPPSSPARVPPPASAHSAAGTSDAPPTSSSSLPPAGSQETPGPSPDLSAISNDVNRILAQLTQLGRRPAPEEDGHFVNEEDGSLPDWTRGQGTLPSYEEPPREA